MCGITGFWKYAGIDRKDEKHLKTMLSMIHHRGPDGTGQFLDQKSGIAMGHARLSIIDLNSGDQPLYSADKNQVLTVNGEFYDYKRIRTELRLRGKSFRTKSDSEIALPLYENHGLEFVDHLRGEFAMALFDKKKQRLILVRDRFGIKPIFYHVNEKGVYYGSEIKALFGHPDIPRKFDEKGLLHQLMQTMVPGTSAYAGIHAVKPGEIVIIEKKGKSAEVRSHKYWDVDFPKMEDRNTDLTEADHVKNVQDALIEAVKFRLEADVPVGCYLSGGIDSCSMLGLAAGMQQSPVKAFTISFDDKDYDESAIAKEMAKKVKADQEIIKLKASDLYGENYLRTLWHAERTFYNTLGVAKWCMSKRVRECGYKTVVTGEGSDELFGGYPAFKRDMFLHGMDDLDADTRKQFREEMDHSNKLFKGAILAEEEVHHKAFDEICGFTPSWIQPWMHTLELARPLLKKGLAEATADYDPVAAIANEMDASQMEGRHALDKSQYTWIKTMLECQILNWGGDRVDMANSMESRPAFLDHHVARTAVQIPPELRIKGNKEKYVLREAMKEILPEVLYKREKFAFMAPPAHTNEKKKQALDNMIKKYMNDEAINDAGIFDRKKLNAFIAEYKSDKNPVSLVRKDALLNHILGLHILHRHFNLEK